MRDEFGGCKRPIVGGKRNNFEAAPAFAIKVSEHDLKRLRKSLDDKAPLSYLLDEHNCQPYDYQKYTENLPSRQKLLQKEKVIHNLNSEDVRKYIVEHLDDKGDPMIVLNQNQQDKLDANNIYNINLNKTLEIERNTRGQADCPQWYLHRQCRLTSSNFGYIINRREGIYPKTILQKIKSTDRRVPLSCRWGKDNEQNALIKYFESCQNEIKICECVGFVVNPKWPWLGASPDALVFSFQESYGAIEIKCPSSKANLTIVETTNEDRKSVV